MPIKPVLFPKLNISESVAKQHHRKLGFKSEMAGRSRATAGVMRRLSMVALRATARHVLRGLAVVGPSCILGECRSVGDVYRFQ